MCVSEVQDVVIFIDAHLEFPYLFYLCGTYSEDECNKIQKVQTELRTWSEHSAQSQQENREKCFECLTE